EQVEPLLEQLLVLRQVVAEQREGFGEGAAPHRDFRAAAGGGVQAGKALEDTNRIVRRQHGDRRAEQDALGAARDCAEHHLGCGNREIPAVMSPKVSRPNSMRCAMRLVYSASNSASVAPVLPPAAMSGQVLSAASRFISARKVTWAPGGFGRRCECASSPVSAWMIMC